MSQNRTHQIKLSLTGPEADAIRAYAADAGQSPAEAARALAKIGLAFVQGEAGGGAGGGAEVDLGPVMAKLDEIRNGIVSVYQVAKKAAEQAAG